jgi:hypothetical protein
MTDYQQRDSLSFAFHKGRFLFSAHKKSAQSNGVILRKTRETENFLKTN